MALRSCEEPDHIIGLREHLVDPRIGIIHCLEELLSKPGDPDFYSFRAETCRPQALCPQSPNSPFLSGGSSTNKKTALTKALGEGVERYCSSIYWLEDLPLANVESANFPCVDPSSFALYSHSQYTQPDFAYHPFTSQTPLRWARGFDLTTDQDCYVPATMVYFPYIHSPNESPITQSITTGLACHETPLKAIVSAICEVVERDAFAITWQARLTPPRISIETLSDANRQLVSRLCTPARSVILFNLTLDHGIPVILSVLKSTNAEDPALAFSAAAHLDPEKAVRKSLEELVRVWQLVCWLQHDTQSHSPKMINDDETENFLHPLFFADHKNMLFAEFLFSSTATCDFREMTNLSSKSSIDDIQVLAKKVLSTNHHIIIFDITSSDIRELGLFVFRAIIPGFHPLFFGHHYRALGGTRLWEVPQSLGYPGVTCETGDNPIPHPFT